MAEKSHVEVLDMLLKNEAKHSDMLDIMKMQLGYLGSYYHEDGKVLSGGDQLTCERQMDAQRHVMDGDTRSDRLQVLDPVCEDWHCLMCFLGVSLWRHAQNVCMCTWFC